MTVVVKTSELQVLLIDSQASRFIAILFPCATNSNLRPRTNNLNRRVNLSRNNWLVLFGPDHLVGALWACPSVHAAESSRREVAIDVISREADKCDAQRYFYWVISNS